MGSKGGNQTSQTYTPNKTVGQAGQQALTMGQTAANLPFQQQVAPVAGMPEDYMSAFAQMRGLQGAAQPYFGRGSELLNQSAQAISPGQIGNYMNPFAEYMLGGMRDLFGQQMKQTTGSLTQAAGGVGADRIGVAQSNLGKQQANAYGQALSGQYNNAVAAAQQDASRQQAAGFGFAQMGPAAQAAMMQGTQGLLGTAGLQQQQRQAELNAPYQWDLARIQHQYQMPSYLSGLTAQQAQPLGGTTTTTYPQQSPWGTIAGLGMTAAGAYMGNPQMMSSGLKGAGGSNVGAGYGNQYGQFNPNVAGGFIGYGGGGMYGSRGGAVPEHNFNQGGGIESPPPPLPHPESPWPYMPRGGPWPYTPTRSQGGGVLPDMAGMGFQGGGGIGNWWEPPSDEFSGNPGPYNPASWENQVTVPPTSFPPAPLPPSGPGSFGDRFSGVTDNPQPMGPIDPRETTGYQAAVDRAMDTGEPLPADPRIGPPPQTALRREVPAEEDIPGTAQPTQGPPMMVGPTPRMPPLQPVQHTPINIPPDTGQGTFARNPWLALMQAGLGTMAAAGQRDARGLPTSPFAAIGKGGMEGVGVLREQDKEATARRRVEFEAGRLQIAAEEARRQAEAHPLEQQQRQIANVRNAQITAHQAELQPYAVARQQREKTTEDMAVDALQNVQKAMKSRAAMEAIGLTPDQAQQLGPEGVRTVLADQAKSKYTFIKDDEGNNWAVQTLNPNNRIKLNDRGDIASRYGLAPTAPQRPAVPPVAPPAVAAVPGAVGPTTALPPQTQAQPGVPISTPGAPRPQISGTPPVQQRIGAPQPAGGTVAAGTREGAPLVGDPTLTYGIPGVIYRMGLKAQGIATGTATLTAQEQEQARNHMDLLTDRLATTLARGNERLLAQRYKEIEKFVPKPGGILTGWPQAEAFLSNASNELQSRIASNRTMLEAPGFKGKRDEIAKETHELERLQAQTREVLDPIKAAQAGRQPQRQPQTPQQRQIPKPTNPVVGQIYQTPNGRRPYLGNNNWGDPVP